MRRDPQEFDPALREIFRQADIEAEIETKIVAEQFFGDSKLMMGFCHQLWPTKKRILKEKYNIDWKTPSEMNPDIMFD